jgi:hypothetical protein
VVEVAGEVGVGATATTEAASSLRGALVCGKMQQMQSTGTQTNPVPMKTPAKRVLHPCITTGTGSSTDDLDNDSGTLRDVKYKQYAWGLDFPAVNYSCT